MERVKIVTFVRVAGHQGVWEMCMMDACRGPPEKRTLPWIRTALERQSESAASAATHIVACFSNLEPLYLIVLLAVVFFPRAWNLGLVDCWPGGGSCCRRGRLLATRTTIFFGQGCILRIASTERNRVGSDGSTGFG